MDKKNHNNFQCKNDKNNIYVEKYFFNLDFPHNSNDKKIHDFRFNFHKNC